MGIYFIVILDLVGVCLFSALGFTGCAGLFNGCFIFVWSDV